MKNTWYEWEKNKFANVLVAICDRFAFILIFYVICHLLTLYKVRSWTQYRYSLAKKMQTSAKKACFQFAEYSFSSAKLRLFLVTSKVLGKNTWKGGGEDKFTDVIAQSVVAQLQNVWVYWTSGKFPPVHPSFEFLKVQPVSGLFLQFVDILQWKLCGCWYLLIRKAHR